MRDVIRSCACSLPQRTSCLPVTPCQLEGNGLPESLWLLAAPSHFTGVGRCPTPCPCPGGCGGASAQELGAGMGLSLRLLRRCPQTSWQGVRTGWTDGHSKAIRLEVLLRAASLPTAGFWHLQSAPQQATGPEKRAPLPPQAHNPSFRLRGKARVGTQLTPDHFRTTAANPWSW